MTACGCDCGAAGLSMIGDLAKGMLLYSAFGLVAHASLMIGPRFPLPPIVDPHLMRLMLRLRSEAGAACREPCKNSASPMLHLASSLAHKANVLLEDCTVACISRTRRIVEWGAPKCWAVRRKQAGSSLRTNIPRSGSRSTPIRINPKCRLCSEVIAQPEPIAETVWNCLTYVGVWNIETLCIVFMTND